MVAIGSGSVRLAWLVSRAQEATGLSLAKERQRAPCHQEGLGNGLPLWFTPRTWEEKDLALSGLSP